MMRRSVCRPLYCLFAVIGFAGGTAGAEEAAADPWKAEIAVLSALKVDGRAATVVEIDDAFRALLARHEEAPAAQLALIGHYFRDLVRPRRNQYPVDALPDLAAQTDRLAARLAGDEALRARGEALALWAEAEIGEYVRRARAWLAETAEKPDPWPARRANAWRALVRTLWAKAGQGEAAAGQFAAWMEESPGDAASLTARAETARIFARDYRSRAVDADVLFSTLWPHRDALFAGLQEFYQRQACTDFADLALEAGRYGEALALVENLEPAHPPALPARLRALAGLKRLDEARALAARRITWAPGTDASFTALRLWAEWEAEGGAAEAAVGLARLAWDVALSDREIEEATQTLTEALLRREGTEAAVESLAAHAGAGGGGAAARAAGWPFQQTLARQAALYPDDAMFRHRALAWLYAGEPEKALAAAAQGYRALETEPRGLERDVRIVAAALRATSGGLDAARAFLEYQLHGPAGPDGLPGTADDLAKPALPTTDWPAEKLHRAHRRMAALVREGTFDSVFLDELAVYGTALSLAGDAEAALGMARAAFAWARQRNDMDKAVTAVLAGLRAADGHLVRANEFLQFQVHGPAGPDGKPGTADDLADPLAGVPRMLPDAFAQELERLDKTASARGQWRLAGHARLLRGDAAGAYRAFMQSRAEMLASPDTATAHLVDLLATRKAADGHPFAEKAVVAYFRHGAAGPDGRVGTPDDLPDPFADLRR